MSNSHSDRIEAPHRIEAPLGGRPLLRLCAALLLLGLLLSRVAAVYTENVNWDEFALLKNAASTVATGELHAGGRPGLAVLVLLPLVGECVDEIAASHAARLLWLAVTGVMLLGLLKLASQMSGASSRDERRLDALLAFGLLAGVPAFLEWSIQVRSDQLAIASGLWGGVALLASRKRPALGLLAGLLFGLGYLASQKLIYVGALVSLLAAGRVFMDDDIRWRRDGLRAALGAVGMGVVLASFSSLVAWMFPAEAGAGSGAALGTSFAAGVGAFQFYRQTIGYSEYLALLPFLVPHALLMAALIFVSPRAWREKSGELRRIGLAWGILALGLAVGLFHAAAFGYFWMTLGLFPALAFAIARRPLLEVLPRDPLRRRAAVVAFFALLVLPAVMQSSRMLQDSQSNQRSSLAFIARNFAVGDDGFHPEGALFCRLASPPFPIWFSQHIYAYFGKDAQISEASTRDLIADFESRQVKFVLDSFRLSQFPEPVRKFWHEHYQPYRGSVHVAGRYFEDGEEEAADFELLVDGVYRWIPLAEARPLSVDGTVVPPGGRVRLSRGAHRTQAPGHGYLVLALNEPPGEADLSFYPSD
jgi:hypothetical protein